MKVLILGFSNNIVNEDSFIPNKKGLTMSCVEVCENRLKELGHESDYICMNKKNINKCYACGPRGWGKCLETHICIQKDEFNNIYKQMNDYGAYIFVTPVYFHEMSDSAKTFFDRLKRCDSFNDNSKLKDKKIVCIACAGGSGNGTEETLASFDTLNHFLRTDMVGRIPVTKFNFNQQKDLINEAVNKISD